jgi:hypothetical protein
MQANLVVVVGLVLVYLLYECLRGIICSLKSKARFYLYVAGIRLLTLFASVKVMELKSSPTNSLLDVLIIFAALIVWNAGRGLAARLESQQSAHFRQKASATWKSWEQSLIRMKRPTRWLLRYPDLMVIIVSTVGLVVILSSLQK